MEDVLTTDLAFIYLLSRALEVAAPELSRLSLAPILADIRTSMVDETDFTKEAAHLQARGGGAARARRHAAAAAAVFIV